MLIVIVLFFSFLSIYSISMHGMKSVQYSLPAKQVAVNFHHLYPSNQPLLPKEKVHYVFQVRLSLFLQEFHGPFFQRTW